MPDVELALEQLGPLLLWMVGQQAYRTRSRPSPVRDR
jgi:hypothetical protein